MTILVPYSQGCEPGTWHPTGPGSKANVICPECSRCLSLSPYDIGNGGKVFGYVQCITVGCGWADELMLDEWSSRRTDREMSVDADETSDDIQQPDALTVDDAINELESLRVNPVTERVNVRTVEQRDQAIHEALMRVLDLVGGNSIDTDAELIQIAKILSGATK